MPLLAQDSLAGKEMFDEKSEYIPPVHAGLINKCHNEGLIALLLVA